MQSDIEVPHKPVLWCPREKKKAITPFPNQGINGRGKAECAGLELDELGCGWRAMMWKVKPQIKAVFPACMTRRKLEP